jgi:hypothetical protein
MPVQVVKNFANIKDCYEIIDKSDGLLSESSRPHYFESKNQYLPTSFENQDFSNEKFYFLDTEEKKRAVSLICNYMFLVQQEIEKFFDIKIKDCQGGLVKLVTGATNRLHSDMYQLDGSPWNDGSGREDEYQYSALLYLSEFEEDFQGGEIFFPLQKLTIKPQRGMLVFFQGDLDHIHEVKKITSGERYAIVMFFQN